MEVSSMNRCCRLINRSEDRLRVFIPSEGMALHPTVIPGWVCLCLFLCPCEYGVHSLPHTVITYTITYFLYDCELGTIKIGRAHV